MPAFNPRVFTNPARLKEIAPDRLLRFLSTWSGYFSARGIDLSDVDPADMPYDELAAILMSPDKSVSDDMINALYYVHETARAEPMEDMISAAHGAGIKLVNDDNSSPADIAVQIWLANPALLERQHAETVALNRSNFMYFAGRGTGPDQEGDRFTITEAQCRQMEELMNPWFAAHNRGQGSRVVVFPHGSRLWILIRHGMPIRREGEHRDDGTEGITVYRPQKNDVLIYDAEANEIGINATTKGERSLYLETLGIVLFGDGMHFELAERYSLQPLLDHGPAALLCEDIPGLARVRFVEFGRIWDGKCPEYVTHRSDDLFETYGDDWAARLRLGRLTYARFKVAFEGDKKERSVTIRPVNVARYERDADTGLLETWLKARGFWKLSSGAEGHDGFEVLESA